jgi:PhnB protein
MPIKDVYPYLNFNGTAAQAIKLYESALGARTESLSRLRDVPGNQAAPEDKDRVSHAVLRLGERIIMLSDSQPGTTVSPGTNMHVCLDFTDPAEMGPKFEALAAGGEVLLPLQDTFWGARFGIVLDAFGVRWMFNGEHKKA